MNLELADPLIEKAVRLAVAGPNIDAYHRERERLYDLEEPAIRETAFQALHRRWFLALRLEDPLWQALAEVAAVGDAVARWCVSEAPRANEEGAELYVSPDRELTDRERRVLVLRLTPQTLAQREPLLWLLRRELLHVADMVDPAFVYRPRLPEAEAGPVYDSLLTSRYAVLWSTTVVGRLERLGRAPAGTRNRARTRFLRAFQMLEDRADEAFERLFDGERPRHDQLVALAREPRETVGMTRGIGIRCPVCGSPSFVREGPESLGGTVVERLRAERPRWRPEQGLCPRCADLYRVRCGVFAASA